MRRKIEITTDVPTEADGAPDPAPEAQPPEIAEPVNPRAEPELELNRGASSADASARRSSPAEDYITALQAEMEELRAKVEEAERRTLYVQAEFQNYRRRKEEELKDLQKFGNSELIRSLLPIVDSFERALAAAEQTSNFDSLVAGVSGTLKQLQSFLARAGVTPIEALGQEFDPNVHEAIGHADSSELPANTVAEEVQKGYKMHDRVLRPTLVKVAGGE